MLPRFPTAVAALALCVTPAALPAQSVWLSPTPPPAIRIVRETARFGTAAAHLANEKAWVSTLRAKKVPYSYVGTVAASGAPEFWFFGGAESFAALQQLDQIYKDDKSLTKQLDTLMAREATWVLDVQTILASYRADLSHQAMFIAPETRHFWVTTFSVRPGQDEPFTTVMKAYVAAYAAAGVSAPWVTYQAVAGGRGPTFYVIMPMESYAAIDADLSNMGAVGARIPSPAAIAAQFSSSVDHMETQVLTVSAEISYVPSDFSNQDKVFWQAK